MKAPAVMPSTTPSELPSQALTCTASWPTSRVSGCTGPARWLPTRPPATAAMRPNSSQTQEKVRIAQVARKRLAKSLTRGSPPSTVGRRRMRSPSGLAAGAAGGRRGAGAGAGAGLGERGEGHRGGIARAGRAGGRGRRRRDRGGGLLGIGVNRSPASHRSAAGGAPDRIPHHSCTHSGWRPRLRGDGDPRDEGSRRRARRRGGETISVRSARATTYPPAQAAL